MRASLILIAAAVLCGGGTAQAQRQKYATGWQHKPEGGYYYKKYEYKVKPTDKEYKYQYVIYKPSRTKEYVYWYNPESRKYWARCATVHHKTCGKEVKMGADFWGMLPEDDRRDSLNDISEAKFGMVKKGSPVIPGSTDGAMIDCPPNDLPRD